MNKNGRNELLKLGMGVIIVCSKKYIYLTFTTIKRKKKVLKDVCFLLEISLHAPSLIKNLTETHTLYPSNSVSGNVSKSNNERHTEGFIVVLFKIRENLDKNSMFREWQSNH